MKRVRVEANQFVTITCRKMVIKPADPRKPFVVQDINNVELARVIYVEELYWEFDEEKTLTFRCSQNAEVSYE